MFYVFNLCMYSRDSPLASYLAFSGGGEGRTPAITSNCGGTVPLHTCSYVTCPVFFLLKVPEYCFASQRVETGRRTKMLSLMSLFSGYF
jgi:hypothetical protein